LLVPDFDDASSIEKSGFHDYYLVYSITISLV
jgi:hypothetical protein